MRYTLKNDNLLIVHFPAMVTDLLPPLLRRLALFFNPGLHEPVQGSFHPDNLVLDHGQAASFLSQSIQFGEQFKKPSDMKYFGAGTLHDFYSETSLSLGWEIATYGRKEKRSQDQFLQAQQLLILEHAYEEKLAELRSLNTSLDSAWTELDASLGIERGDEEFAALDRDPVLTMDTAANWRKLLWAFALFLPGDSLMLITEPRIADELEEAGVAWENADADYYWADALFEGQVQRGVLKTGNQNTYLGKINRDIHFLRVNRFGEEG